MLQLHASVRNLPFVCLSQLAPSTGYSTKAFPSRQRSDLLPSYLLPSTLLRTIFQESANLGENSFPFES